MENRPANEMKISGIRPVQEALRSGRSISRVMISENLSQSVLNEITRMARTAGVGYSVVPPEAIDRESSGVHQGVVAFVSAVAYVPLAILLKDVVANHGAIAMLDGITDVRNFGAICRTAECMGFSGVVVGEHGTARIDEQAVKASAGALMRLPVCRVRNLVEACSELSTAGITIYGITEKGDAQLGQTDFERPLCLVLGDESKGISRGVLQCVDAQIAIPMAGEISSLNVGVAFGMAAFEVHQQLLKGR